MRPLPRVEPNGRSGCPNTRPTGLRPLSSLRRPGGSPQTYAAVGARIGCSFRADLSRAEVIERAKTAPVPEHLGDYAMARPRRNEPKLRAWLDELDAEHNPWAAMRPPIERTTAA